MAIARASHRLHLLPSRFRAGRVGYIFIAPAVLLNLLFFLAPLVMTVWVSLHDWALLGTHPFIGLTNYAAVLNDAVFWQSFVFTTKYTILVTPAIFIPATGLAILVDQHLRGVTFFRALYFTPVVLAFTTASLMWRWIYNELFGLANFVLMSLGIIATPVAWLGDANTALLSVIVMVVWKVTGFTMVLLLAGMQAIPRELYEAAGIDGAGIWPRFLYLTLPLLRPTFALALTISVIGSYLGFDHFYIMTGGGPVRETHTIVMWIYRVAFQFFEMGTGAAMSMFLLVFLMTLSYVQIRILRNVTEY